MMTWRLLLFLLPNLLWAHIACKDLVKPPLVGIKSTFTHKGETYAYTYIPAKKNLYLIPSDLPQYENHFLIAFEADSHITLWYKGYRIETELAAFRTVRNFSVKKDYLPATILFAIKDLTELQSINPAQSITCASSACKVLQNLNVEEIKNHITATGFLENLIQMSKDNPNKIEMITLGQDADSAIAAVSDGQKQQIRSHIKAFTGYWILDELVRLFR